ncbi:MAG: PorT family protein [Bacteroidales bacterium]|nr:PorT family protein [Bacteroidales bacterium]
MKKIVTILAASMMLLGIDAIAQPAISAGYLRSFEKTKAGSISATQPTDGFYAGFDYTLPISEYLGFAPGLYYAMTSKQDVASVWGLIVQGARQTDHMLNAPLMLNFGMDLSSDFRFFLYGGPTLSFGLASIYKVGNTTYDRFSDDGSLNRFDLNRFDLNRFDVMLGVGAGVEMMEKFRISFGYDWGMLNRTSSLNVTVKRDQMHVGISFLF